MRCMNLSLFYGVKSIREKQVSYINAYIRNLERWWAMQFLKIFAEHRAWRNKCRVWLYRGAFILTRNPRITPVVGDGKAWKTPSLHLSTGVSWKWCVKSGTWRGLQEVWEARWWTVAAGRLRELLSEVAWRTGTRYRQRLRRWAWRDWKYCNWGLSSLFFVFLSFFLFWSFFLLLADFNYTVQYYHL